MQFFKPFIKEEITIFETVKQYFETLPPIANDEYENAFHDLAAQYGCGGMDYLIAKPLFTNLIEAQVEITFEKLPSKDKNGMKKMYETYFIDRKKHFNYDSEEYIYSISDLAMIIVDRFKAWIHDTQYFIDEECLDEVDDEDIIYHPRKTQLEKAFDLFVANDELRPNLNIPFEFNGFVVASNGHILIKVKKEDCDFEIDSSNEGPSISNLIPEYNRQKTLNIDNGFFEDYKTLYEVIDVKKDVECSTCTGERVIEWSYKTWKRYDTCPECLGAGLVQKTDYERTGKRRFSSQLVKMEELYFKIDMFYVIIEVQRLLGGDIEVVSLCKKTMKAMLIIGVCEVVIMSYNGYISEYYEVIDVTDKLR